MASSYICFARAVTGQKFGKQAIRRWFYKLVDKDDYLKSEAQGILAHIENLSNKPEDNKK